MAEALEWFQCQRCGRRQRWAAEIAGRTIRCACGAKVLCPAGPGGERNPAGSFTDTIVEEADSPSARAPIDPFETLTPSQFEEEVKRPLSLEEVRATKRFYIWTIVMLFGLSMLIHAVIVQSDIYITLAAVFAPISLFGFHKARVRWQRGRPFWRTLMRSLGD